MIIIDNYNELFDIGSQLLLFEIVVLTCIHEIAVTRFYEKVILEIHGTECYDNINR